MTCREDSWYDIVSLYSAAFLLIHLGYFAAPWTGVTSRRWSLGSPSMWSASSRLVQAIIDTSLTVRSGPVGRCSLDWPFFR